MKKLNSLATTQSTDFTMTEKQHANQCYVFSETTLQQAFQEWLEIKNKNTPEKKEAHLIVEAALPWFLKYWKQPGPILMFTHDDLISEVKKWKSSQITAFPHREKRIDETCSLLIEFFESQVVIQHKMIIIA